MNEITSERNRLVAMGIALLVLAILVSTAHRLPEAQRLVTGYLSVGGIVRLVILFIMLGIVLSARPPLATVAEELSLTMSKTKTLPERMEVATHVTGLATEVVNIIIIAILWPIVAGIVNTLLLMDVEGAFDWVPILVTIAFVAILLWRLYLAYQSLKPVLDATSGGKARLSCPKCGTLNTLAAKFCSSCGAELRPTQTEGKTQTLICPKCGVENKAGSKFCENCGESLSKK